MFFVFSKILTLLLFPLPLFLVCLLILSFWVKGKKLKLAFLFCILSLWSFSSFVVSQWLIGTLEKDYLPKSLNDLPNTDAIVVLGGMINPVSLYPNRIELLSSADRLTDAVYLFSKGKGKYLVFTGGSGVLFRQDVSESTQAEQFLLRFGVPKEKMLIESKSKNTMENAIFTAKLLKEKQLNSVLLITSAFHMKRALYCFEKQGIQDIIPYPTDYRSLQKNFTLEYLFPSVGGLQNSTLAIKEWIGILAYKGFL